jgi:hypothetical protein
MGKFFPIHRAQKPFSLPNYSYLRHFRVSTNTALLACIMHIASPNQTWKKMKTKNFFNTLVFALCLGTVVPSMANVTDKGTKEISAADRARAEQILKRLEEIKAMDIKSMPTSQKRQLRKEVKAAKKELNDVGGGVYISVGALIIIILLLILIL